MVTANFVRTLFLVLLFVAGSSGGNAEIIDSASNGFTVKTKVEISAPPAKVYSALVSEVGRWWDSAHTFSRDSRNLYIEGKAGGCFCERLSTGGGVHHMTVVFAAPEKLLRMTGGIGPLQELAVTASMTWKLSQTEKGTDLEASYRVGGYHPAGLDKLAPAVDSVFVAQVLRLKNYIETGKP
ncbi:MAG TPA: SRPBCC domain-containing protein [Acidobacteriota bacterium]|jgi:uncharacterized protein YndB with AHSA1/START domain